MNESKFSKEHDLYYLDATCVDQIKLAVVAER